MAGHAVVPLVIASNGLARSRDDRQIESSPAIKPDRFVGAFVAMAI
jgi:hypothetical protein